MILLTHRGINISPNEIHKQKLFDTFYVQLKKGYGLEFDIQITKDMEIIVQHEPYIINLKKQKKLILELTLAEILKEQNAKEDIILFQNLLQLIQTEQKKGILSAIHIKHTFQKKEYLDELLTKIKNPNKFIFFDLNLKSAKYLKEKRPDLHIAASVSHPFDIFRFNNCVGGTLMDIETVFKNQNTFDWVWLDEWDRRDAGGKTKKLYTIELFKRIKEKGIKIALVTPELHATSPNLLGNENHSDAIDKIVLFNRIAEIMELKPDIICTDYADIIKKKMNDIKIKRIIIWGLKKRYHTHRHIHQAFYKNAKKLGYSALWLEDEMNSQKYILPGDLIITADPVGKMVPEKFKIEEYNLPIRDDIYYCFHHVKDIFKINIKKNRYINLDFYSNESEKSNIKIDEVRYFNTETKTLFQPWGTDLLEEEFKKPVFNSRTKFFFWIGSIWNDKLNRGNIETIKEMRVILKEKKFFFIHIRFIPDFLNIFFIRKSRIAPAIAGNHQVSVNYLPCRMFKNISYGQLGLTNVQKFKDILKESFIPGDSISEIIEKGLSLNRDEYISLIEKQQEIIKKYTYKESISNIIKAFDYVD